jgi:hypothetical protein
MSEMTVTFDVNAAILDIVARLQRIEDTLTAKREKSARTPKADGTGSNGHKTIYGQSVRSILNWLGNNKYKSYDAAAILKKFGVESAKKTIDWEIIRGRNPEKYKLTLPVLTQEQVLELLPYKNLAVREQAKMLEAELAQAQAPAPASETPAPTPAPETPAPETPAETPAKSRRRK